MNSGDIIVNINNIKDIDNITDNTKYINLSIDSVDSEVIDYFVLNGVKYSYSDTIDNRNGFIYASYEMFKYGESFIDNIIDSMPNNLNELETIRYIYIALGKTLCSDINVVNDKNEIVSFSRISTINNIWGALSRGKVSDMVVSKIFMYVCSRLGFKCELVSSSIKGNVANKIYVEDSFLIVDLFNDIHNIQGGFSTKYFDKYNDNKIIDRRVSYIKDEYMDYYMDKVFKELDYSKKDTLCEVLTLTGNLFNINNIGVSELFKIYRGIFDKYVPNYDIRINNLFVYNGLETKEHFTLFSYDDSYYSFNYSKGYFVNIDKSILCENIKSKKIGVYDGEDLDIKEKGMVL